MSETVEFEINRQLKNYVVIVKNMSEDREKSFYDAYGKDALVFGYIMKQKIRYRMFRVSKTLRKMQCFNEDDEKKSKKEKIFTSYSGVPSYKLQEIVSVLDYYHINYIIIDKMQNYKITHMKQFKDNKYDFYYQKGLYYKRIIYKMKSINEFLRNNSGSGEIMYLIYDIERCIDDYCKRNKEKNNGKLENKK
mgnify:FL=1